MVFQALQLQGLTCSSPADLSSSTRDPTGTAACTLLGRSRDLSRAGMPTGSTAARRAPRSCSAVVSAQTKQTANGQGYSAPPT